MTHYVFSIVAVKSDVIKGTLISHCPGVTEAADDVAATINAQATGNGLYPAADGWRCDVEVLRVDEKFIMPPPPGDLAPQPTHANRYGKGFESCWAIVPNVDEPLKISG